MADDQCIRGARMLVILKVLVGGELYGKAIVDALAKTRGLTVAMASSSHKSTLPSSTADIAERLATIVLATRFGMKHASESGRRTSSLHERHWRIAHPVTQHQTRGLVSNRHTVSLATLLLAPLAQADVSGDTIVVTEFSPSGSQATTVAELQANWGSVLTGLSGAVTAADVAYPGAGINEVELEVETEKTGTTTFWKIALVTVDLIELDYLVDAMVPAGDGFRFSTAPVNAIPGDFNPDAIVDALDLSEALNAWGLVNPPMDLDGNDIVDAPDLAAVLSNRN